jgi:hypothetical protein
VLSYVNFWLAASMGLLIATDKAVHFLPGFVLSNVFAHAHLAALGWATMMVVGVGYRLLPMIFPSKIPSGSNASAILLETGIVGLFTTLLLRSAWTIAFGVTIVAGPLVDAAPADARGAIRPWRTTTPIDSWQRTAGRGSGGSRDGRRARGSCRSCGRAEHAPTSSLETTEQFPQLPQASSSR